MTSFFVEGNTPLMGDVNISGSVDSSVKIIYASMFSNEDVTLENVPKVKVVENALNVIRSIGGEAQWAGTALILNGSKLSLYEIPFDVGSNQKEVVLLAGPLLFRFGKAIIPKYSSLDGISTPINRVLDTWRSLGVEVTEDDRYYFLNGENMSSNSIVFKLPTHIGTDNAILTSVFVEGETIITNASEESEVDNLVDFVNLLGGSVTRINPKEIKVEGSAIFKGTKFTVCPDKTEAVIFSIIAAITNGNITIRGIQKEPLIPFVNFLNKVGVKFEISDREFRVWRNKEELNSVQIETGATPGLVSDWQSYAVLLLTQANGESLVHDTLYINRFNYVVDLNRMGAKIQVLEPSQAGLAYVVSDDSYDLEKNGEPLSVARVEGYTKLRGERLHLKCIEDAVVLVMASLCAEGKSEIVGLETVLSRFENFVDKLISLGAKVWEQ